MLTCACSLCCSLHVHSVQYSTSCTLCGQLSINTDKGEECIFAVLVSANSVTIVGM